MSQKNSFLTSSIGKKILMAATGLLLVGFLTTHLAGNFLLFDVIGGKDAFNNYAHALASNPLIYVAEAGLLGIFIVHIVSAIQVSSASRKARPQGYAVSENLGKSTLSSRTMLKSGSLILAFLVFHLVTFKFGTEYSTADAGKTTIEHVQTTDATAAVKKVEETVAVKTAPKHEVRDLYRTVIENFKKPWYSILYIISMIVLGFHLAHGFQSAFKTLGLNHPKYTPCITKASYVLGYGFALGYSVFPIYFGFIA